MKKMLTFMLMTFIAFSITSCGDKEDGSPSPVKTVTADAISTSLSKSVIIVGKCENTSQVKYDIDVMVKDWFKIPHSQGIGSEICKQAVGALLPFIVGTAADNLFKEDWECSSENFEDAARLIGETACSFVPLSVES